MKERKKKKKKNIENGKYIICHNGNVSLGRIALTMFQLKMKMLKFYDKYSIINKNERATEFN